MLETYVDLNKADTLADVCRNELRRDVVFMGSYVKIHDEIIRTQFLNEISGISSNGNKIIRMDEESCCIFIYGLRIDKLATTIMNIWDFYDFFGFMFCASDYFSSVEMDLSLIMRPWQSIAMDNKYTLIYKYDLADDFAIITLEDGE